MDEAIKSLVTIERHRSIVSATLRAVAYELMRRADLHDQSKLSLDEFEGFAKINVVGREHAYGSDEYYASLKAIEPNPIPLHYSRNDHHPEHHKNLSDMEFPQLVEMVCDWYAASVTYGKTTFQGGLTVSFDRWKFSEGQKFFIQSLAQWIEENER